MRAMDSYASDRARVRTGSLEPGQRLPLVVEPDAPGAGLGEWVEAQPQWIDAQLEQYGGVLFRGFDVPSSAEFTRAATALTPQAKVHANFYQPGNPTGGNARTAVTYPHARKILWHNEDNFIHTAWPRRIMFYCLTPAQQGGETPIADCRRVFELIDPSVRERFVDRGVMYVDNLRPEFGTAWQKTFGMESREEVEAFCRKRAVQFEWVSDEWLRVRYVRPAVFRHPATRELLWINVAHLGLLTPTQRAAWLGEFQLHELPTNSYYGDGTVIEDAVIEHIHDAYARAEVAFPWRSGDVLVLDNLLVAHGRNPFEGTRHLYAAFGERVTIVDLLAGGAASNPELAAFCASQGIGAARASGGGGAS